MNENPTVSIIVPIFNTTFLVNCIDSIGHQSYPHLQMILVDCCLSDESTQICQTFAEKDDRILLLQAETSNAAHALNLGLTYACGEFVQFLHADDYMENNMTEKLIMKMTDDKQLALCGYREIQYVDDRFLTQENLPALEGTYRKQAFMKEISWLHHLVMFPYNKLYRNEIIQVNQIKFPERRYFAESTAIFNLAYWDETECVQIIAEPLYLMTKLEPDLRQSAIGEKFDSRQRVYRQVDNYLRTKETIHDQHALSFQKMRAEDTLSLIREVFHSANALTNAQKKETILAMLKHTDMLKTLQYPHSSMQEKVVASMLRSRNVQGVYTYFKTRQALTPLYHLWKKSWFGEKSS